MPFRRQADSLGWVRDALKGVCTERSVVWNEDSSHCKDQRTHDLGNSSELRAQKTSFAEENSLQAAFLDYSDCRMPRTADIKTPPANPRLQ